MNNENMLSCLEGMAYHIARAYEDSNDIDADAQIVQAYAQICTAIAAFSAPRPFIQIGTNIINRADIIRAEIHLPLVRIYTRQLETDDPQIIAGSQSKSLSWLCESAEGKALLEWLQGQSEVLAPYEAPAIEEESPDPFIVSAAESMLAEAQDDEPSDHPF